MGSTLALTSGALQAEAIGVWIVEANLGRALIGPSSLRLRCTRLAKSRAVAIPADREDSGFEDDEMEGFVVRVRPAVGEATVLERHLVRVQHDPPFPGQVDHASTRRIPRYLTFLRFPPVPVRRSARREGVVASSSGSIPHIDRSREWGQCHSPGGS